MRELGKNPQNSLASRPLIEQSSRGLKTCWELIHRGHRRFANEDHRLASSSTQHLYPVLIELGRTRKFGLALKLLHLRFA